MQRLLSTLLGAGFGALLALAGAQAEPAIAAAQADTGGWAALESEGGVQDVATGGFHTCAISQLGRVWCWGDNFYGQLGDGSTSRRTQPVPVTGLSGEFRAVAAGAAHSCALSAGGTVWCWGRNLYGQLGIGSTTSSLVPVALGGPMRREVRSITSGPWHTCALSENGRAFCWGLNQDGQLGDGSTSSRTAPVQVAGFGRDGRALSAGNSHTCGLDRTGRAMCWGNNRSGRLGDGTITRRTVATPVALVPGNARMIAAGSGHTCLLVRARRVWCWGDNQAGQLGNNSTTTSLLPRRVPRFRDGGVVAIAAGGGTDLRGFSCAINSNNRLQCWGSNFHGQIGDGTNIPRLRPTPVLNLGNLIGMVFAGGSGDHACVTAARGRLMCWGYNTSGQLGDGSTTTARAPVRVLGALHTR